MKKNIDKKTTKKVNCPLDKKVVRHHKKSDENEIPPLEREKDSLNDRRSRFRVKQTETLGQKS